MSLTAGAAYTNVPGVDDPSTQSSFLCELPGVSDKAVAFYVVLDASDYKLHARVINTSGTTVDSVGAEQTLYTSTGLSDIIDDSHAEAISATRILVTWRQRPSSYEVNCAIATVSGDTVTLGTIRQMQSSIRSWTGEEPKSTWVTDSLIMTCYSRSTAIYVRASTVSGSTINAPGTEVAIDTSLGSSGQNTWALKGAGDGSRVLVFWDDASNMQVRVAKITTGTTITVHTVNSFLATSSVNSEEITKVPGDTTTFVLAWSRGSTNTLLEAKHATIVPASDTVTLGTTETWDAPITGNVLIGVTMWDAAYGVVSWTNGGTPDAECSEISISGTTLAVDDVNGVVTGTGVGSGPVVVVGVNRALTFYGSVDAKVVTTSLISTGSKLWLRNGSGVWSNIGDSSWSDPVRSVAYKPGTNYQTIFAMVGATLYRTDNQGTSWTSKATLTFTPSSIELVDGDVVKAYTKDAAGTNRVASINNTTITYFDTDHSTTGAGSTMRGVA